MFRSSTFHLPNSVSSVTEALSPTKMPFSSRISTLISAVETPSAGTLRIGAVKLSTEALPGAKTEIPSVPLTLPKGSISSSVKIFSPASKSILTYSEP